ncbi:scavenger receptor cysteine-rich protein-like protein [Leptotrombidium deliense]|uniref:Scavenger receptor cysteine-rich protein-like protein n=1 Tax=Leptotrombidium deliense TaxID=299467 RepID=A0A443S4J3_9ACAR|nr:scavenger receptor cysteine-rich protein-like protein [Leptotrombidium deliense]
MKFAALLIACFIVAVSAKQQQPGSWLKPRKLKNYILNIVKFNFSKEKCGENQVFDSCGTTCPTTCENKDEQDGICTDDCQVGCRCKDGYVLHGGKCILPKQCPPMKKQQNKPKKQQQDNSLWEKPKKCGKNEHWSRCDTTCPRTCEHVIRGQKDEDIVCTLDCMSGCFCNDGYVRKGKRCVRESECFTKTF